MNQIQFETTKKHCLFVMLPEQWKVHSVTKEAFEGNNILCLKHPIIRGFKMINIPNGYDWQLQGFVSELTDEQKEGIVESKMIKECWNDILTKVYVNYSCQENAYVGKYCQVLSESFASLLTSLNVLLVNPYGENEFVDEDGLVTDEICYKQWNDAQQHVGQWYLLTCNK